MPQKPTIEQLMTSVIERTRNPLGHQIIQDAYAASERIGKLFGPIANESKAKEFQEHLLSAFPEDMNDIAADPNFITALAALFAESLKQYVIVGGSK